MRGKAALWVMAVALLVAACSSATVATTTTQTESRPTTSSAPTTTSTVAPTTSQAPPTTGSPAATTTTPSESDGLPGWDTWTLIYASLETSNHSQEDALVIASSINQGSVLKSDDYPSLNPGYWVVYGGEWGDRSEAGAWCPSTLDVSLTCYPRYLGSSIPRLLAAGAALAELGDGQLVVMEPDTAEVLATFDGYFGGDGAFPGYFNLASDYGQLYYGLGFEDSWYSCESEQGQVWQLDLSSGTEQLFGDGWSPSLSPDGRWLAVVAAEDCYPDPEVSGWVVAPGSQVEVFDLTDGDTVADYVLRTDIPPTSYEAPGGVRRVTWDPARDGDLLIYLADGSVRRIGYTSPGRLGAGELIWASEDGEFASASMARSYLVEWDGESTLVTVLARPDGGEVDTYEIEGWVSGFAVGRSGEIIISTWEYLILPDGEQIPIDGGINNLAW